MPLCRSTTKKGERCQNQAQEGSDYCYIESHGQAKEIDESLHSPKKTAMVKALKSSLGVVTTACKNVGISRMTHYNWMGDDELYKKKVEELDDVAIDFVESQMFKQIRDGSNMLVKYFMSTRGKKRGYGENLDITTKGDKINDIQFLTPDED